MVDAACTKGGGTERVGEGEEADSAKTLQRAHAVVSFVGEDKTNHSTRKLMLTCTLYQASYGCLHQRLQPQHAGEGVKRIANVGASVCEAA
jgi:hypothetical protein